MRMFPLSLAIAMLLSGCLPQSKFNVTVRVLDDETGQPIQGAWVFADAEVITEPQVDRFEVVGANRGQTGSGGAIVFTRAQGMYRPRSPKDWLWKMVDEKQSKLRKPKYIAGGSIVVAAAKYGVVHQPFAIEDSPAYKDWLKTNPGEEYGGLLGLKAVRSNRKALLFKGKDLARRVEITLRLRKQSAKDLAVDFRWTRFVGATWEATSTHTGGSEDLQIEVYRFFAQQMKAAADETHDPYDKAMFKAYYYYDEAVDHYINADRRARPEDQDSTIQVWLAEKAVEVLPQDSVEVKEYATSIRKGVADEGSYPGWRNHFLDPKDPTKGLSGFDSALAWAGLDQDNPRNEWDLQDARRYYAAGDKAKAYEALGHVLRLLVNLAIPKYTQMQEAKDSEFETTVEAVMKNQAGQLPPDYWWSTKAPTAAATPRARFDDVAGRTVALGLEAGGGATNGHAESAALAAARKSFPATIGQAVGLLRDFQRLVHPASFAKKPDGGDGGDGPQAGAQASSGTVTDTNKFNKFTSGTDSVQPRTAVKEGPVGANEQVAVARSSGTETDKFNKFTSGTDKDGGPKAGVQGSSATATDTNKFNKFTSGTDMSALVFAGTPDATRDDLPETEVREYLSLFPELGPGAARIDKAEGERRRERVKDHLRGRGFSDERKLLKLMDHLSRQKDFGSLGEHLPRAEQSELARHSDGFAAAKAYLKNQVWHVSESNLQGLSEKYCRVLEDTNQGDAFRMDFLVELDRFLQSARPNGYLPKTKVLRAALVKIASEERSAGPARAEAIKMLARRYSGDDIAPVLHAATRSEAIEIRKAAYFSLRKLPMTPALLGRLKSLYQEERVRDQEAAYVLITTLRRFPIKDTPVILPVLSELRKQESTPFLVEKLDWAIWALKTEEKYEKKP